MDKNEVIVLSSDEESDSVNRPEPKCETFYVSVLPKPDDNSVELLINKNKPNNSFQNVHLEQVVTEKPDRLKEKIVVKRIVPTTIVNTSIDESPEIVDLEEFVEHDFKSPNETTLKLVDKNLDSNTENHSNCNGIKIVKTESLRKELVDGLKPENDFKLNSLSNDIDQGENASLGKQNLGNVTRTYERKKKSNVVNQNPDFFDEFVLQCGSLEEVQNDKERLIKKLKRRFEESDPIYVQSTEFKMLIDKCKCNLNKRNLYLIAKEVSDRLNSCKKVQVAIDSPDVIVEDNLKNEDDKNNNIQVTCDKKAKKRIKIINKIIKRLNEMGDRIRELEQAEVDLSDEEESTYIQVQRYRERFCQIYKKLCKYKNEVSDAGRIYSRKICFTGSKYPAVNSCIEKWLNKTKRFPDFNDIMKLFESQSAALGLPSNKESLRAIAIETFQQVGLMLQRRRKYDLWDSFCDYLEDKEDPAVADSELEKVLKQNFENRVKKEQEIFNYYAENQEKNKLEPEEVPEDEANRSPVESGNEDENEIEEIERIVNEKLDSIIEENQFSKNKKKADEILHNRDNIDKNKPTDSQTDEFQAKETKNNYQNCKSLKWRCEARSKSKEDSENLKTDNENENHVEKKDATGDAKEDSKNEEPDVELVIPQPREPYVSKVTPTKLGNNFKMSSAPSLKPLKRNHNTENESPHSKKKKTDIPQSQEKNKNIKIQEIDIEKEIVEEEIFDVNCCHIEHKFNGIVQNLFFDDFDDKKEKWGKGKVFRDLTNVNRLIKNNNRKGIYELFSHPFFHRGFRDINKPSWKKRFMVKYKYVGLKGEKCALNHDEKSDKSVHQNCGDSNEKESTSSSDTGNGDKSNFFSGHGSGNEEDNNDGGENRKKNESTEDDMDENNHEEEEEENEEDAGLPQIKTAEENGESNENNSEKLKADSGNNEAIPENVGKIVDNERDSKDETKREIVENVEATKEKVNGNESHEGFLEKTKCKKTNLNVRNDEFADQKNKCIIYKTEKPEDFKISNETKNLEKNEENVDDGLKSIQTKDDKKNIKIEKKGEEEVKKSNTDMCKTEISKEFADREMKKRNIVDKKCNVNKKNSCRTGKNREIDKFAIENNKKEKRNLRSNTKLIGVYDRSKIYSNKLKEEKSLAFNYQSVDMNNEEPVLFQQTLHEEKGQIIFPNISRQSVTDINSVMHNIRKRSTSYSTSDEERVKRFLLNSPSSISITPPRRLWASKPPSQAALKALATLRNLKGISATRVVARPRGEEDVVVIGESSNRPSNHIPSPVTPKQRRATLPVISNVQSMQSMTPKIVTVQGNASEFGTNTWHYSADHLQSESSVSSIRISNVWGSLPGNSYQTVYQNNEYVTPSCSFRQGSTNVPPVSITNARARKKTGKKTVEYVVLD